MIQVNCDWCGKIVKKSPSQVHKHNFCCKKCLANFSNETMNPTGYATLKSYENMSVIAIPLNMKIKNFLRQTIVTFNINLALANFRNCYNMTHLNEKLNPSRMTETIREKIRNSRLDSGDRKSYRKINGRHEHRQIAEEMLGRSLKAGEVVHHIDGNKRNNNPNNLRIFESQAAHAKFHKDLEEVMKMING